jgi:hypothetical protein
MDVFEPLIKLVLSFGWTEVISVIAFCAFIGAFGIGVKIVEEEICNSSGGWQSSVALSVISLLFFGIAIWLSFPFLTYDDEIVRLITVFLLLFWLLIID